MVSNNVMLQDQNFKHEIIHTDWCHFYFYRFDSNWCNGAVYNNILPVLYISTSAEI